MNVLDAIGVSALALAMYAIGMSRRGHAVGRRTVIAATVTAALVAIGAVVRMPMVGDASYAVLAALIGLVAGAAGSLELTRGSESVGRRGRLGWVGVALFLVRLVLLGAVVASVTLAVDGEFDRSVDERVQVENGWNETRGRMTEWHPGTRIRLSVETPRSESICPKEMTRIRRGVYAERPSRCAAAREIRARYGAEPSAVTLSVLVKRPDASTVHRINALALAEVLLFLLVGLCIERVLSHAARGRPFDRRGLRWIRGLGLIPVLTFVLLPVLDDLAVRDLVGRYLPGAPQPDWQVPLLPLFFVVLLFALAEIWRFGASLQEDVDGTV